MTRDEAKSETLPKASYFGSQSSAMLGGAASPSVACVYHLVVALPTTTYVSWMSIATENVNSKR